MAGRLYLKQFVTMIIIKPKNFIIGLGYCKSWYQMMKYSIPMHDNVHTLKDKVIQICQLLLF